MPLYSSKSSSKISATVNLRLYGSFYWLWAHFSSVTHFEWLNVKIPSNFLKLNTVLAERTVRSKFKRIIRILPFGEGVKFEICQPSSDSFCIVHSWPHDSLFSKLRTSCNIQCADYRRIPSRYGIWSGRILRLTDDRDHRRRPAGDWTNSTTFKSELYLRSIWCEHESVQERLTRGSLLPNDATARQSLSTCQLLYSVWKKSRRDRLLLSTFRSHFAFFYRL